MKKLLLGFFAFLLFTTVFSQPAELVLKSSTKGFYIEHKVQPKEGLFPLSRLYNVHPRHIAVYNKHDYNKGLDIGQIIHIPLSDTNFTQNGNSGVPVYYTATQKESLTSVSSKAGKVQVNNLRSWNSLSGDNLDAGKKLIVGFLITNEMKDRVVTIQQKKQGAISTPVAEKKELVQEIKKPEPEVKKEEPKKPEPELKKELTIVVKEEPKTIVPAVKTVEEKSAEIGSGYFRNHFTHQVEKSPVSKEQTVTSSIFKTTSGWQDTKYYLLINGIDPGTIVRITNPGNNKILYAKVLYSMEGIRQNQGLDIRISDAAAAALSISETDKFIVKVNY